MTTFKLIANVPDAVTSCLSGDGKQKLKDFVSASSFRDDGKGEVWLVDTPLADVKLLLPDDVIDGNGWAGGCFDSGHPSGCLEVSVIAEDASHAYEVLAKDLFRLGGERAHFPVYMEHVQAGRQHAKSGRCMVGQLNKHKAAKDKVEVEYLTVSLPHSLCGPESAWSEESVAKFWGEGNTFSDMSSEGGLGDGLTLLQERLSQIPVDDESRAQFDPITIIMLIAAIIPLIQNCFLSNATPKRLRQRLGNRFPLALNIRKEIPGLNWREALRLSDKVLDLAQEASDDDLNKVIKDAMQTK